ncbi:MAG: hypothetical protein RI990_176, partial [Planctomycetota bacterium]
MLRDPREESIHSPAPLAAAFAAPSAGRTLLIRTLATATVFGILAPGVAFAAPAAAVAAVQDPDEPADPSMDEPIDDPAMDPEPEPEPEPQPKRPPARPAAPKTPAAKPADPAPAAEPVDEPAEPAADEPMDDPSMDPEPEPEPAPAPRAPARPSSGAASGGAEVRVDAEQIRAAAQSAMKKGEWAQAANGWSTLLQFLPGDEEAVRERARAQAMLEGGSVLGNVATDREVRRQQATAQFTADIKRAQSLLEKQDYDQAKLAAVTARTRLDLARNVLGAAEFESMTKEAEQLIEQVTEEGR